MHFTCAAQIKTEIECADSVMNHKSTSGKENLDETKIAEKSDEAEKIEKIVELCLPDKVDLEPEELFDEDLQPRGGEQENSTLCTYSMNISGVSFVQILSLFGNFVTFVKLWVHQISY